VELLGHHRCLCTQLPFGGAGSSLCARRSTERRHRSNGGSGSPHHSAGSAPLLPGCFGSCRPTFFARKVSWVSDKKPSSRRFVNRGNPPRTAACDKYAYGVALPAYSPNCVEGEFRSSRVRNSRKFRASYTPNYFLITPKVEESKRRASALLLGTAGPLIL
jgi:hypothetical protein